MLWIFNDALDYGLQPGIETSVVMVLLAHYKGSFRNFTHIGCLQELALVRLAMWDMSCLDDILSFWGLVVG